MKCLISWLLAAVVALVPTSAMALSQSSVPAKFPIPWGNSAGGSYINTIPTASQIGIVNCRASLTDGFPPLTFQPAGSGGCAPFGGDFNGILKQITQWSQWAGAGATVPYDSGFSSSIGGYPKGTILASASVAGCYWISTVDNNSSDPDTGGANWTGACPGGGIGGTSTGSANAQVVAATPFALIIGATVRFYAGFSNTSSLQINVNGAGLVNVLRLTPGGLTNLNAKDVTASQMVEVVWDGTQWELWTPATLAYLNAADQTLTGGANVTSLSLSAGSVQIDCGLRPLQYIPNNGAFTITAPANDGSCMLMITNGGGGGGTVSFSGFTTNGNTGEAITTTANSRFVLTIWRINAISSYITKALQ